MPEMEKEPSKMGKIHNQETWHDWSYAPLQVELTPITT
jgi:hypothetical protein